MLRKKGAFLMSLNKSFFLVLLFTLFQNINSESTVSGKTVQASDSMVVTRHFLATEVGNTILQNGGNAIDASVAISFALSVVLPQAAPIGGGGFMVIHEANTNQNYTIDYRETAPARATRDMFITEGVINRELALESYLSSGTPGTVYGLFIAHQKFGKLPWRQLIEPSITLAKEGFIITETLGTTLSNYADKLAKTKDGKEIFFNKDQIKSTGDLLVQTDLANTLERIATFGAAGFYKGKTAMLIASDMKKNNGLISSSDLRNYKAKYRKPISFNYKDLNIVTMGPPSSGGLLLALMFNMLEEEDLNKVNAHDPNNILITSEIMQKAYALRTAYMGDPDFYDIPYNLFLSKDNARLLSAQVNREKSSQKVDFDPYKYKFKENTTHYSVIDNEGNAVSTTTTLNTAFGSGVIIEGTGVLMNNEMDDFAAAPNQPNYFELLGSQANQIEPNKRPLSSMTPTIVFKDDKPLIITGAQGGSRIITAVLQVILNYYEYQLSAQESVYLPRYHHQWSPEYLMYEDFDENLIAELESLGFSLFLRTPTYDYSNGITSSIMIEEDTLIGVSDFRSDDFLAIGIINE